MEWINLIVAILALLVGASSLYLHFKRGRRRLRFAVGRAGYQKEADIVFTVYNEGAAAVWLLEMGIRNGEAAIDIENQSLVPVGGWERVTIPFDAALNHLALNAHHRLSQGAYAYAKTADGKTHSAGLAPDALVGYVETAAE